MTKTDNGNLYAKLDLRRYFLSKYFKIQPVKVFDCCQGNGIIWSRLRSDYNIARYWGVDLKEKKGRLKISSERILSQSGWDDNVVDIDTYGSPWKHWFSMLPNIRERIIVFLTIGFVGIGGGQIDALAIEALGLSTLKEDLPSGVKGQLNDLSISYCLAEATKFQKQILECKQAVAPGRAQYIGLAIEPFGDTIIRQEPDLPPRRTKSENTELAISKEPNKHKNRHKS